MKKIFFPILISVIACNNSSTPAPVSEEKKETSKVNVEPANTNPVSYFKAAGSEPGWSLEMSAAIDGSFPVVLLNNYGEDTLTGALKKAGLMNGDKPNMSTNEVKYTGTLEGSKGGEAVELSLLSGGCTDDAGKSRGATCKIKLAKQRLTGCGDYVE